MKRHGDIVPVTFNPYLKKKREDGSNGRREDAVWNRSFPAESLAVSTNVAALPTTTGADNRSSSLTGTATVPPSHSSESKQSNGGFGRSDSTPTARATPKISSSSSWIPQSKLISFGSAEILTVPEIANLLLLSHQQPQQSNNASVGRDVRVTGVWHKEATPAGHSNSTTTTTTSTHWLVDPLADFHSPSPSSVAETSRIPVRNLQESFAHPRIYEEGNATMVTVFGRLVDGAVEARLAVVVTGGMHMGLYTRAVIARRAVLEDKSKA